MNQSKFQFLKPKIVELQFRADDNFPLDKITEGEMKLDMSAEIIQDMDEPTATVILHIALGEEGGAETPYFLRVSMSARFKWEDTLEKSAVESLLKQNAVALLISYVRPVMSNVTGIAGFEPFDLPFIDMTKTNE